MKAYEKCRGKRLVQCPARKCLALACAMLPMGVLRADAQDFALQVTPASVEIPADRPATVLVVLQNNGSAILDAPKLSWFGNFEVNVKVEPKSEASVVPHGTVAWTAQVSADKKRGVSEKLFFRADFGWRAIREGGDSAPAIAVAPLTATSQPLEPAGDIADVTVELTTDSVNENRPGFAYVVIKSKTDVPLKMPGVIPDCPKDMSIDPVPSGTGGLELAPGESRAVGFSVNAKSKVTPGKQLLAFEVPLAWEKGGQKQSGVLVTTKEVEVGIFGETAILAALGVPTFLFLPGFLMLSTLGLVWRIGKPAAEIGTFPLKANTPDFYLVAITLSILAAIVYRIVTNDDYLTAYGLVDVMLVWFGSMVVGVGAFGIIRIVSHINEYRRKERENRHRQLYEYSTSDDPLTLLQKLGRNNRGVVLETVEIVSETTTLSAALVDEESSESGKSWVTPNIQINWAKGTEERETRAIGAIHRNDFRTLMDVLGRAASAKAVTLVWDSTGSVTALKKVDSSSIRRTGKSQSILVG